VHGLVLLGVQGYQGVFGILYYSDKHGGSGWLFFFSLGASKSGMEMNKMLEGKQA
jgi:hypothetical protein